MIITIRPDEHEAVRRRLPGGEIQHHRLAYYFADVDTERSRLRVALTRAPQQGNIHAQDTANKAIGDLNPRWILVVGIAGGFPNDDYTLGDVVVSSRFIDWTREAVTDTAVDFDLEGGPLENAARRIVTLVPTIATLAPWSETTSIGMQRPSVDHNAPVFKTELPEWRGAIARSLEHHARHPRGVPVVVPGPIIASDRLVKSSVLAKDLKHFVRSAVAVEMESWGVYVAADSRTPFVAVRGISDIIGLDRDNDWTLYACETAAAFALHLLRSGQIEASLAAATGLVAAPVDGVNSAEAPAAAATATTLAVKNVIAFGDTDVLPFPFELQAFKELPNATNDLVQEYVQNFDARFKVYPPQHERTLVRAGYTGFRWVTQLDPLWNLVFLAQVISLATEVESRRIATQDRCVFSYRFAPDAVSGALFAEDLGWAEFRATVHDLSASFPFAVRTDIADFYPRVSHARLKQQLAGCDPEGTTADQLLRFLGNYVNQTGIGLPVGGPGARMLSELSLDDIDHILNSRRIRFVRFADDYVLFSETPEAAQDALSTLAFLLYQHEGLSLQKLKTRIMSAANCVRHS